MSDATGPVVPRAVVPYNAADLRPVPAAHRARDALPSQQRTRRPFASVVTKKADKSSARDERVRDDRRRGRASALNAPRRRVHALAPEHVGELGSVAALTVAVLGVGILIVGLSVIVMGLTISSRYATSGDVPPNVGQLGQLPLWAGIALTVLSLFLVAAPVALLADVRRARLATVVLALLAGLLSVGGLLLVISRGGSEPIVTASLGVVALFFGASALVLARPGR